MYIHNGRPVMRDLDDEDREAIAIDNIVDDYDSTYKVSQLLDEFCSFGLFGLAKTIENAIRAIAIEKFHNSKSMEEV
jgi:hypothetical protein